MKYPHVIFLSLIILVSGCVGSESIFSSIGLDIGPGEPVYTISESLELDVEAVPDEVYEGKSTTLFFDLINTGDIDIKDINLEITDMNQFTSSESSKTIDLLESEDRESWNWELNLPEDSVQDERDVSVRYNFNYASNSSSIYEIVAMSETEYTRLERQGELESNYNLSYFKTDTPVEIDISISKEQPLFEDLEFYVYVEMKNKGSGTISEIKADDLTVTYPSFLEFVESSDFRNDDGKKTLTLKRPLSFIDKETRKSACKFKVSGTDVVNSGQFGAQTSYLYSYYKTLNIKLKPK